MASEIHAHHGLGEPYKRKEDARFIRGQGTYVDDVQLPGMLYGDIVRSPYAHALIRNIDSSEAMKVPGVVAVITGKDLEAAGLAWMPTLSADMEAVLAVDRVLYQMQEVAFVVATSRYAAADGVAAVDVDYEPLPVVVDPKKALDPEAPLLRPDKKEKQPTNQIYHWETGDEDATNAAFAEAERNGVVIKQDLYIPRIHPAPIETCGCVANYHKATGKLTVWLTSQAPHAHRTLFAMVAGLPEHRIRIISPDVGGGFGNKVPIYPGYVCAVVASVTTGKPVKWIEDRSENIGSTGFARDYHIHAEIAADKDGMVNALRVHTLADHGAFDAAAQPTKFPAGLFHICTGSYDFKHAFVDVDAVHTNKAPGGIAYRCSFRVTEASYLIERMMDTLAHDLGKDPAQLRLQNFIKPEAFPYRSALNWTFDSGNYEGALHLAMKNIDYEALRQEQAEKRARGELMGIGISTFTEIVGAGPGKHFDIAGIQMFDSCEVRVHPTGKVLARIGVQTQGQGHETTFAQIIAAELGLSPDDVDVEHGDTDTAPYGLGTYASRSTPVAGAATALAARKVREKAKKIAAYLLEVGEEDLEWEPGRFFVKGAPAKGKTIQDLAFAAYTNCPPYLEPGLEAVNYYDPPNLTYPFGAYICVVDIDRGTGMVHIRRFMAVDDCGTVINPMVVEGQIHGGLTQGLAPAMYEELAYDADGNILAGNFQDYLIPTAMETPLWETDRTVTPSPHHPIGAKGVGESPTVGAPQAIVNAVVDALAHVGVRHIDMPLTPWKVWNILKEKGLTSD
ncbi:aerobic carbon-monoxide dehydrogenase large subunit [Ktedonobacter racemifer]|uniref:Carbon-monoxide dehydrogenase, large subunit n=1 Tax=Ktedonobacter racemifer DSM 44963 TaxID=485913 RepID=D6TQ73_KTERA|nr:aerobic carbon-monoxide dehydrogenase large subunit [Ktedonobacter racemifer]EFH85721.1 carbon-monoxide dehydrogenase, large subunit [Ktedonobacter racemifer DSM 44963]